MNTNQEEEKLSQQTDFEIKTKNTVPTPNINSSAKMYYISDIAEERHNFSQQTDDSKETSFISHPGGGNSAAITATQISSDINPLLDEIEIVEKRKRPSIVKRSPNFARPHSRVHPMSMPPQDITFVNFSERTGVGENGKEIMYPSSLQSGSSRRPLSMHFKRSTSEIDMDYGANSNVPAIDILGHRRTQSYGAPGAYRTQKGLK